MEEQITFPCLEHFGYFKCDKEKAEAYFRCYGYLYSSMGIEIEKYKWKPAISYLGSGYTNKENMYALLEEGLNGDVDCQDYVRSTFGSEMKGNLGNFCATCPVGKPGWDKFLEQDYKILAQLVSMPAVDRVKFLSGVKLPVFFDFVNLNHGTIYGNRMEKPCVAPIPEIILGIILKEEGEFLQNWPVDRLAGEVTRQIEVMAGEDIAVFADDAGKKVMRNYLEKVFYKAEGCGESALNRFFVSKRIDDEDREDDSKESLQGLAGSEGNGDKKDIGDKGKGVDKEQGEENVFGNDTFHPETASTEETVADKVDGHAEPAVTKREDEGADSLKDYPYFNMEVRPTAGAVFTPQDHVESIPLSKRRYLVPFAENEEGNVIVHHEIPAAVLEKMIDITSYPQAESELNALETKVRKDSVVAVEVVWVIEQERYVLVIWNEANRRFLYSPLIEKWDGRLHTIPYVIRQFLASEKRKVICFQPYLLCGISGLYYKYLETKNVHSIYTMHRVLMRDAGNLMEDVLGSYFFGAPQKILDAKKRYEDWYGQECTLLSYMPFYAYIMRQQYNYAEAVGKSGLCASQYHKDLMYGYSYLAAGIYPSRQGAMFKLRPDDHVEFLKPMDPCISYIPSYIMEFTFMNVDEDADNKVDDNIKNNQKARRILLKEMAKMPAPWYHTGLKLLYVDNYRIVFFVNHMYRSVHKTDVSRILMHETYRYKIPSNKLYAKFWGTGMNVVRYINRH